LPYPAGQSYLVLQGNEGKWTHKGRDRYAWDFRMPEGTPVAAAASGIVVEATDHHGEGGLDSRLAQKANAIVLDHGRGLFSLYEHLQKDGARVHEGDSVLQGEIIGLSGNTGWSAEPHLHFEVTDHQNRSLPVCFVDVSEGVPQAAQSYVSSNDTPAPSLLPRDAFAQNGVLLTTDLPARFLCANQPLVIRGRVTRPAGEVVAFFLRRGEKRTIHHDTAQVDETDGFSMIVDLSDLEGPLDFAIAPVQEAGRFWSSFSIPTVVRRGKRVCSAMSGHPANSANQITAITNNDDRSSRWKVEKP
jgi:murein DD-endopeptidase MepM/ murein hydrolase activator NlpD